jgi:hypothetical protein
VSADKAWASAVVFPKDQLVGKNTAGFPASWCDLNGKPPRYLLVRRAGTTDRPVILKGARRLGPGEDVAVTADFFAALLTGAPDEGMGIPVDFLPAGYLTRIRYTAGARRDIIAAIVAAALAIVSAVVAFSPGKRVAVIAVVVFALAVGGALLQLWRDFDSAIGS